MTLPQEPEAFDPICNTDRGVDRGSPKTSIEEYIDTTAMLSVDYKTCCSLPPAAWLVMLLSRAAGR